MITGIIYHACEKMDSRLHSRTVVGSEGDVHIILNNIDARLKGCYVQQV